MYVAGVHPLSSSKIILVFRWSMFSLDVPRGDHQSFTGPRASKTKQAPVSEILLRTVWRVGTLMDNPQNGLRFPFGSITIPQRTLKKDTHIADGQNPAPVGR